MAQIKGDFKMFLMIFIGTILGVTLLIAIANQEESVSTASRFTGNSTNKNITITPPTTGNATLKLTGRELIGSVEIRNATLSNSSGYLFPKNFSINTSLGSDGQLGVYLIRYDEASKGSFPGGRINVSYEYVPDGYVGAAPAQISSLVVIFGALAIVVTVIVFQLMTPDSSLNRILRRN